MKRFFDLKKVRLGDENDFIIGFTAKVQQKYCRNGSYHLRAGALVLTGFKMSYIAPSDLPANFKAITICVVLTFEFLREIQIELNEKRVFHLKDLLIPEKYQ